jgi:7-carboxy-7-deazaguanine synthase
MGEEPRLAISEIFGPTFQGEGPSIGRPCLFLRLAGCNLACSWCDTPYTWDWNSYDKSKEVSIRTMWSVMAELRRLSRTHRQPITHLVISGGEPMLQGKALNTLCEWLRREGWTTEIETAGTVLPPSLTFVDHYNVSPKLSNSNNAIAARYRPDVLDRLNEAPSKAFKFVVEQPKDFNEIDELVNKHDLSPVYVMPEGVDADQIHERLSEIADEAIKRNYRITTRLHVTIYGNQRGV